MTTAQEVVGKSIFRLPKPSPLIEILGTVIHVESYCIWSDHRGIICSIKVNLESIIKQVNLLYPFLSLFQIAESGITYTALVTS